MSNYESVRIKGPMNWLFEPPSIEVEHFENGRIAITACADEEIEETDPEWPEDPPSMTWKNFRVNFDITKEQAAELGHALLRWSKGNGCTPRKNSKPRKRKSAPTG